MIQRLLTILFISVLLFSQNSFGESLSETTLQDRYKQAKFFYNQLENDSKLGKERGLWLKGGRNFRKVYLSNPKSEYAPKSLFMLGRLYLKMYDKFKHQIDIKESIGYFRDCQKLFPKHRLGDDCLFFIGHIYIDRLHNNAKGKHYFTNLIEQYPEGDMAPRARSYLYILSKNGSQESKPGPDLESHNEEAQPVDVHPVKYWSSANYCRIIIEASGSVKYTTQQIDPKDGVLPKLLLKFEKSTTEKRFQTPISINDGLLKNIVTEQLQSDSVSVTLTMESISTYNVFTLPDPFRLVVDVHGVKPKISKKRHKRLSKFSEPSFKKNKIIVLKDQKKHRAKNNRPKKQQSPEKTEIEKQPELSLAQQLGLGVKTVVLDPGHGGKDPGAIAHGLKEKDIVLTLSKAVAKTLQSTLGCKVVLTREDDSFLSLEKRAAIANGNNGDLFISLHVNAHPISSVKGLETYFLNLTNDREAMRVAAYENATSELQVSDLQDVLSGILKNSKIKESTRLAHTLHTNLVQDLHSKHDVKDLGVKQAPFYVLIGAEMPAILIEVGFISNESEAILMKDELFLQNFANGIAKGVKNYIDSNIARLP